MSSETTELHPEKSYFDKKFAEHDQTKELLQLVRYNQVLSIVSLVLVILIGVLSWNDSKQARILVETRIDDHIQTMDNYQEQMRLSDTWYATWINIARQNGLPVPEEEE